MNLIAAMWISAALIIVISDYYRVNSNEANAKSVHHYCVDHMLYLGMKTLSKDLSPIEDIKK